MAKGPICASCAGSGELPTDYGAVDCPDCGGAGFLPSKSVLVEWRSRDVERVIAAEAEVGVQDVRWLLGELRAARSALTDVIALAHDIAEADQDIAMRIRVTASRALGLYEVAPVDGEGAPPSA
ncbi:MAG: hypothetical protein QM778_34425 [Myxococcales bacterium]